MMQTDICDILSKLKSLSDSTDLIIYQHTRENDLIDKWFSTIKETANSIINNTKSSGSKANGCPVIPDLLSQIKGEKLQTKRNRVSSLLAATQKDHARLSHRKSRASLRKIILEKKNGNQWEISQRKRSDGKSAKNSDSKSISPNVKNKVSKFNANICPRESTVGIKTSVNIKDVNSHSTPQSNQTEILVPNSDEKTPVTRSKIRDIVNMNPVATLKKQRQLSSNKKYCTQELTPDIIQKKTTNKKEKSDARILKHDGQNSVVSDQTCKIDTNCNSTPQNETIILDSSDSIESSESKPRTRSKRKSSIQLVQDKAKKTKISSSESQTIKNAKLNFEDHVSESKYSKKVKLNKNAVIQPKISGTTQQINAGSEKRILREIQKKEEVVSQNTKKLRTMQQMKIKESKKNREIKMEKAMQQRLKIESEKKERMKCRTVSKQENVQQKETSVKKTALRKVQIEEKADSAKKVIPTSQKINPPTTLKSLQDGKDVSSTPKKAPPKPVRTPVKKAKQSPVKQNTEQTETKIMNQTFTNPSVEALSSNKDVFTKPSPINSTYVAKAVNVTSTPTAKKTVTKISKTPVSSLNKKKNSYNMTPSESSFVSYDVSEIKSDDSDEEETSNNKPIPSWASGVRLRNALLNQQYNPIDTSELFGNYFDTLNLATIMGIEKRQYFKRTSSAIWTNSPNRSLLY